MARRTGRDEGTNADPGGQNVSVAPNLGAAQQSSNDWMGITNEHVSDGTSGARPNSSHAKYGGDRDDGTWFKGSSSGVDSSTAKQLNAGVGGEKDSWNSSGQYGPGSPNYLAGGYGARENMTYGGDENRGQLVGDGVNSTGDTDATQYFISGKVPLQMPKNQFLAGTDEARDDNMPRAQKGIGPGYTRKDSKNQRD